MKSSRLFFVLAAALAVTACQKNAKPNLSDSVQPEANTPSSDRYTAADLDRDECLKQRVIYFDLDQDLLKPEFAKIIACHNKYLADRPEARLTLEGHADERSTREYNLALGERRSTSVALVLPGANDQVTNVTYGEERPVCLEGNEDCWWKNRRVELVYTAK